MRVRGWWQSVSRRRGRDSDVSGRAAPTARRKTRIRAGRIRALSKSIRALSESPVDIGAAVAAWSAEPAGNINIDIVVCPWTRDILCPRTRRPYYVPGLHIVVCPWTCRSLRLDSPAAPLSLARPAGRRRPGPASARRGHVMPIARHVTPPHVPSVSCLHATAQSKISRTCTCTTPPPWRGRTSPPPRPAHRRLPEAAAGSRRRGASSTSTGALIRLVSYDAEMWRGATCGSPGLVKGKVRWPYVQGGPGGL